jgi:hypothetical protein
VNNELNGIRSTTQTGFAYENHEAQPHGAAIAFKGSATNINFDNCNFTGNKGYTFNKNDNMAWKTAGGGGAICFFDATDGNVDLNIILPYNVNKINSVEFVTGERVGYLGGRYTTTDINRI